MNEVALGRTKVCEVCPHRCAIPFGKVGLCGARGNKNNTVVDLNYGRATALAMDPIEKKPLSMFMPGHKILSYGSYGCNMRCPFCQNSDISMTRASDCVDDVDVCTRFVTPEMLAKLACEEIGQGNIGIALTYNEPMIAPEFLFDLGEILRNTELKLVVVTNGYSSYDIWDDAVSVMDAVNVDLKCFSAEGYKRLGAPDGLEVVKRNIESAFDKGVHVEVTTLIVPGLNDDANEFAQECAWLSEISPDIPLHITRFYPRFKMSNAVPINMDVILTFHNIATRYLHNVF